MMCPYRFYIKSEVLTKDCLEDDCAFWDDGNKCCCRKSMIIELIKLNERLEDTCMKSLSQERVH